MVYKVLFWISLIVLILSVAVMIFSLGFFNGIIQRKASDTAIVQDSNYNVWGIFPGESNILIYKNHYFYDFSNPESFYRNNTQPIFNEQGPFTAFENIQLLNYNISNVTDSVKFNFFRFYNATDDIIKKQNSTKIKTFNLVNKFTNNR